MPIEHDRQSKAGTVAAAAATAVLAVITYFSVLLVGLAAAMSTCDDAELHHAACTKAGFWWASTGSVYLQLGGAGVAIIGAWVWPRRSRLGLDQWWLPHDSRRLRHQCHHLEAITNGGRCWSFGEAHLTDPDARDGTSSRNPRLPQRPQPPHHKPDLLPGNPRLPKPSTHLQT